MTRIEINIGIEKNRTRLLNLVLWWLICARFFSAKSNRVLPRRIGLWVSDQIFMAEKALYYLRVAIARSDNGLTTPITSDAPLTVSAVIARLKALKKALINLRDWAATSTPLHRLTNTYLVRNNSLLATSFVRLHLAKCCAANCRAPPARAKMYIMSLPQILGTSPRVPQTRAYCFVNASKMRAQERWPLWKEFKLYFSLGEWIRSSDWAKPTNSESIPSIV